MMSAEIFLNEDKLVVAKQGFDAANPSLPEGDKLFDSDWLFSSTIVEAGIHVDQASYESGRPPQNVTPWNERTHDSYTQYINFTPLPFVPTVLLLPLADSRYWQQNGLVLLGVDPIAGYGRPSEYWRNGAITVTNSQIIIPRCYSKGGGWHFKESFIYLIMAM